MTESGQTTVFSALHKKLKTGQITNQSIILRFVLWIMLFGHLFIRGESTAFGYDFYTPLK